MRFGYVLLGLVALMSGHASSGQCSNGLAGIQAGDICCDVDCGTCGGGGCGTRPGGSDNCCTGRIRNSGVICSDTQGAPCIVENESMCDNGLPGVQNGDICCDPDCGTCGGSGCGTRPGGSDSCCSGRIRASGMMCDTTNEAPCIVNEPTDTPAATSTASPTTYPTAYPTAYPTPYPTTYPKAYPTAYPTEYPKVDPTAYPKAYPTEYPTEYPKAYPTAYPKADPTEYPTEYPKADPTEYPTVYPKPTPTERPVPLCDNGLPGVQNGRICCEAQCESCGGSGCGRRPGGPDGCCTSAIASTGTDCSIAMAAPCIIDN